MNGVFTFYILPLHSYLKIKSSGIERYLTIQSVDKPKFLFLRRKRRIYVFPLTGAAEKHLVSEKPLNKRFFKDTGVVPTGIECSPKIFDFRANGVPVGERVDFFDTLFKIFILLLHVL